MKHQVLTYFWLLFFSFSFLNAGAQSETDCGFTETGPGTTLKNVELTPGTLTDICEGDGFSMLSAITIAEAAGGERAVNGDDTGSLALVFELPDGLEFKRTGNVVAVTTSGSVSFQSKNVQGNAIFIFLSGASPGVADAITISGIEVKPAGAAAGNYEVFVSTAIGCINGIAANGTTAAGSVTLLSAPALPAFSFSSGPQFCLGETIPDDFLAVNSSGSELKYYSDAALSLEKGPFADPHYPTPAELGFSTNAPGAQAVYVIARSANGCESAAVKIGIDVPDIPSLDLSSIDNSICPGEKIEIDLRNYSDGNLSWVNNEPAIGLGSAGGDFIYFTAAQNNTGSPVNASVVVTALLNGCEARDTIHFNLVPGPAIGAFSPAVEICNISGDIDLRNDPRFALTIINGGNPANATWTYSGKGITSSSGIFTASGQSWSNNELVDINVTFQREDGCSTTRTLTLIKVLSNPLVHISGPADGSAQCRLKPVELSLETNDQTSAVSWQTSGSGTFSGPYNSSLLLNTFYYTPGATDSGPVTLTVTTNNPGAPCSIDTDQITINVFEPIVKQQEDLSLCPGETVTSVDFTSLTMPDEGIFNWSVADKELLGLSSATGTGSITGITAAANNTGADKYTTVTVTQTANGCSSKPMTFKVLVKPQPVTASVSDLIFCPGDAVAVNFVSTPSGGSPVYNWTSSNPAAGLAATGTGHISFTAVNATAEAISTTVSYTATLNGCVSEAKSFVINVKPAPGVEPHANIEVCSGEPVVSALSSTVAGAGFSWTIDNPLPGMPASGEGDLNFTPDARYGTASEVRTVRVRASKGGCTGEEQQFDIILKPLPKVEEKAAVVILPHEEVAAIGFSDNSGGQSTYTWTATNAAAIGLPSSSGTGALPAFKAAGNSTGSSIISTVSVTAVWNACPSSDPMQFNIELTPQPEVVEVSDVVACPEELVEVAFTSDVSGTTFKWTNNNTAIGLGESGNGDISFTTALNNSTSEVVAAIVVTPVSPEGLEGEPATFTITVEPAPVVAVQDDIALCPGDALASIDFSSATMAGEGFFQWETDNKELLGLENSMGTGSITGIAAGANTTGNSLSATVKVTQTVNGCTSQPMTFQVVVNPQPLAAIVNPQAVCSGELVEIDFSANTDPSLTSFSWRSSNPSIGLAASGNGPIRFTAAENMGTADITSTITYKAEINGCESEEQSFTIRVKPEPVMDHPADLVICSGDLVRTAFSASLEGSDFSWSITDPATGLPETGMPATGLPDTGSGNLNFSTEAHFGSESISRLVKVRAVNGGCVGEEKSFFITLKPQPLLEQQTELEIFPGEQVPETVFTDNSNGESAISWTASGAAHLGLPSDSGAGALPAFTANDNTSGSTIESLVIVDALWNGCRTGSMQFLIKLRPRPIMSPEEDIVACPDTEVVVAFESNVSGTTFKWTNNNMAIGLAASGSGNISFTAAENFSGGNIESVISVTPVSPAGFAGQPVEFKIILKPVPLISNIADIILCPGETAGTDFLANTSGETFYWENDNPLIGLGAGGTGNFTFTGAENLSSASRKATISYYASREGCRSETKTFTITLKNKPVPVAIAPASVCSGDTYSPAAFADDSNGKSEFHWTIDKPELLGLPEASGTGNLPLFRVAENLSGEPLVVSIVYYSTLNGCVSNSLTYKVNILPAPVLENGDVIFCANDPVKINLKANTGGGESFVWKNSNPSIGLTATSGSGGEIEFTALNSTGREQSATITVTVTKDGCSHPEQAFTIRVKPLPRIINPSAELLQNLCSGEAVTFTPLSDLDRVRFVWVAESDAELQNFNTSGTGPINENVLNKTSRTATIVYTIRAIREGEKECTGEPVELVVNIAPVPDLQLPQQAYTICNGEELTITPASATNIEGTYYEWTVEPNELGVTAGSGSKIVQSFFSEENKADTIVYTIKAVAGNCSSAPETVKVFIRPFATVNAGADFTVCEQDPVVLQATLGGGASFGTWTGGAGVFQNALASTTTYRPDPSETGSVIQFVFTTNDPAGPCTAASDTVNVTIEPLPELAIINLPKVYCTQNNPFPLQGNPAGGTFSGEGVVYNEEERMYYFDPAVSGIGLYRVTYSYRSNNGCTGTSSGLIDVSSGANPDFNILSTTDDICETQPRIGLTPLVSGGVFDGPGVEITGGKAWFNPGQGNIGENIITYTISDQQSGCTTSSSQAVWVNARPAISIGYENECAGNKVRFYSTINSISEKDEIKSYQWSFGDGFSSTEETPVRQYSSPGVYDVSLKVQTALSCEVTVVKQSVVVSNIVNPDFSFENICGNDTTLFIPEDVSRMLDFSNPSYVTLDYSWDFGDPASGESNISTEANTRHRFSGFGEYEVRLTIRSSAGCAETISRKINIVPAITGFPHVQQFEGSVASSGWFTEGVNNSWQYGIPSGEVINKAVVPGTNVWATGLSGGTGYRNNERSYVISPCFDLKDIEQPMISMNLFMHAEPGRDGAVLQYSKDGGRSWTTLGNLGEGLNWYNTTNIVADPAGTGIGNEGWSGTDAGWKEVAWSLDELSAEAKSVMFRVSFASDATNVGEFIFEGLALDDVYVGPRNKKVLVENFTNTNAPGFMEHEKKYSGLMADQELAQDVVLLQYHTPFPQKDSLYLRNPEDPATRALFYGIYQSPALVVDGVQQNTLNKTVISRQSLSKPDASVSITIEEEANSSLLRGTVEISPLGQVEEELILYINAVEAETGSGAVMFRNVLKKILPETSGIYLSELKTTRSFSFEWEVSKDFAAGNLGVVAYLQEKESKKVLQSSFKPVNVPVKAGRLTSLGDISFELKKMKVFPNPVSGEINLQTNSLFGHALSYEIIHLSGTVLQRGTLEAGKKEYKIGCSELIDGMYILRVFSGKSEPVSFKVMVMSKEAP